MLHIVTGTVEARHYMREHRPDVESFMHLVEAADEDEARAVVEKLYEMRNSPYDVSYSVSIRDVTGTISMAMIDAMIKEKEDAKKR